MFKKIAFVLCIATFNITQCSQSNYTKIHTARPIEYCGTECTVSCQTNVRPSIVNTCLNWTSFIANTTGIKSNCLQTHVIDHNDKDNPHTIAAAVAMTMTRDNNNETYICSKTNLVKKIYYLSQNVGELQNNAQMIQNHTSEMYTILQSIQPGSPKDIKSE